MSTLESSAVESGHVTRAGHNIHALMWQALRGAASPSAIAALDERSDEEAAETLPLLWDAVWKAAGGAEPDVSGVSPALPAPQLLAAVRRSFLDLIGSLEEDVEVQRILRVLVAIELVEDALRRDRRREPREPSDIGAFGSVAELAHDLRSPLTSIVFLVDGLRRGRSGPLSEAQQRDLALIYSAAFTLNSIADDLADLARGTGRLLEREPTPFCIGDLVRCTMDIVRHVAEQKGLEIRLALTERDCRIGRPVALARVLLNLVGNALKFTSAGFVEVAASDRGETLVRFSVRDTGIGLTADVAARVSGGNLPPARRGVAEPVSPDVGLGLAICRKLVSAMGGQLRVEEAEGGGTRFFFELDLPLAL